MQSSPEYKHKLVMEQLWCLYIDMKNTQCLGIVELNSKMSEDIEINFEKTPPLAFIPINRMPDLDSKKSHEEIINFWIDLNIITLCPNLFLLLEAIHENKSSEIINFHLNVFDKVHHILQQETKKYQSANRITHNFSWTINNNGWVINQYNQKIIRFSNKDLAYWISLVGPLYYSLFKLIFHKTLRKIGDFNPAIYGDKNNRINPMTHEAIKSSKETYEKLKVLTPELQWDIKQNLKNMKIFFE